VPIPGGEVTGLYHACFDPNMVPGGAPQLLTEQMAVVPPALGAADEDGRWSLTWRLATTGAMKIGVWRGCERRALVDVPSENMPTSLPIQTMLSRTPNQWCGLWRATSSQYLVRCAEGSTQ